MGEISLSATEIKASALSALGESVSFGRFLSESLDWGRFSSFNHNKYIEEAERYSRPGSVAQKKALFEAHYKKRAALRKSIATMEGLSSIDGDFPEQESKQSENEQVSVQSVPTIEEEEEKEGNQANSSVIIESPDVIEVIEEQSKSADTEIKLECTPEKQPLKESYVTNQESKESTEKKRGATTSKSKLLPRPTKSSPSPVRNKVLNSLERKVPSLHSVKENISSPRSSRSQRRLGSNSNSNSLHLSVNLEQSGAKTRTKTPSRTEGSSVMDKIKKFEAASKPLKTSEGHMIRFKTPTKLLSKGEPKLITPERTLSARKIAAKEPSNLQIENLKSKSLRENTFCSVFSSFSLHRKSDKKEDKEEKAENELREFRQSLCFKARPLPEFYRRIEPVKESNKKVLSARFESPLPARISKSKGKSECNPSLPPINLVSKKSTVSTHSTTQRRLGTVSRSIASFSEDKNKWTITFSSK